MKMKAAELVGMGLGLPKFINTETIKTQLMELGYSRDEASLGWVRGCSGPYGPGSKQYGHQTAGSVNPPLSLEAVLFNGRVANIPFGGFVWATPDGRKAGTPISAHVAPTDQMDQEGPLAHINSVTKLGIERQSGTIHNMYLTNVDSDDKKHRMIDLIDAYHSRGGHHLQINCIDKNILIDAQKHPEKYPTLMVRVAGYVAYFVDLSQKIQDCIIARTSLRV